MLSSSVSNFILLWGLAVLTDFESTAFGAAAPVERNSSMPLPAKADQTLPAFEKRALNSFDELSENFVQAGTVTKEIFKDVPAFAIREAARQEAAHLALQKIKNLKSHLATPILPSDIKTSIVRLIDTYKDTAINEKQLLLLDKWIGDDPNPVIDMSPRSEFRNWLASKDSEQRNAAIELLLSRLSMKGVTDRLSVIRASAKYGQEFDEGIISDTMRIVENWQKWCKITLSKLKKEENIETFLTTSDFMKWRKFVQLLGEDPNKFLLSELHVRWNEKTVARQLFRLKDQPIFCDAYQSLRHSWKNHKDAWAYIEKTLDLDPIDDKLLADDILSAFKKNDKVVTQ